MQSPLGGAKEKKSFFHVSIEKNKKIKTSFLNLKMYFISSLKKKKTR
jgi:hypothetical protein